MCQRAAWPGQILLYNGGGWGGKGKASRGRKGGKGVGEARANALLMVFIQAWRLQARPPHWQLGVNFPLLAAQPSFISDCCHSGEVENHQLQLQPPFHIHDTPNTTVTVLKDQRLPYARLNMDGHNTELFPTDVPQKRRRKLWARSSVLMLNKSEHVQVAGPAGFQMAGPDCLAVQAPLTGTGIIAFFYLWLHFWRLIVETAIKFHGVYSLETQLSIMMFVKSDQTWPLMLPILMSASI